MEDSAELQSPEGVVYVPTGRLAMLIDSGSGVVATKPARNGRVLIHYEGNRYGAVGMEIFANRVLHAHGRQVAGYPTIAQTFAEEAELERVGSYDPVEGEVRLDSPAAAEALAAWLGVEQLEPSELYATGHRYETRRSLRQMLSSGNPVDREKAKAYARAAHVPLPI